MIHIDCAAAEIEMRRRDFHSYVRSTFPEFVDGWVYRDLCGRLKQFMLDIRAKKSPRLIVCLPPRMGKSSIVTVRFGGWCLLNNPTWEVIVGSYSRSLVNRFSRFARSLIESHPYVQRLWPTVQLSDNHASVEEWRVKRTDLPEYVGGGTYRAVGKGGSVTGSGANCLILDDLLKDAKEADSQTAHASIWDWYTSTARTRLTPGGGILIVMTRWSPDDLIGRLLYEEKNNPEADKWDLVEYRAIAEENDAYRSVGESILPERWTSEELLKIKANTPPRWWEALYQQRPSQQGGNLFKENNFKRYLAAPDRKDFDQVIQVWDLRFSKSQAKTSSFVCGWVIGMRGGQFFILDEMRGRWSYAESREAVRSLSEAWPEAIAKVVENKANGPALESDLEVEIPGIILYDPRGDKFQRAERVLPLCMAGNVYFPADEVAPWAKDAIAELTLFPRGSNDDRVDCLSMGLSYMLETASQVLTVTAL